uniref:Reverse transcriptase domain-containing protein n=1 Tax=Tanacetum cinerariifolium TaxID=118510 RepID=A0A6L2NP55_TANCI|nr:hypothetical protein [Tanacetum cinerariifolium]
MEAYVDDMVIRSMDEQDMLEDIKETFERLHLLSETQEEYDEIDLPEKKREHTGWKLYKDEASSKDGSEAVLPFEINIPPKRTKKVDSTQNEKDLRISLDVLEERWEIAAIREAAYKKNLKNTITRRSDH